MRSARSTARRGAACRPGAPAGDPPRALTRRQEIRRHRSGTARGAPPPTALAHARLVRVTTPPTSPPSSSRPACASSTAPSTEALTEGGGDPPGLAPTAVLVSKALTRSDGGGRVIMPRAPLEAAFPFMETHRSYVLAHASAVAAAATAGGAPAAGRNGRPPPPPPPLVLKSWANGSDKRRVYVLEGSAPLLRAARAGEGTPVGLVTDAAGRVEFHIGTPALVASLAAAVDGDRAPRPAKRPRAAARPPRASPPPPSPDEATVAHALVDLCAHAAIAAAALADAVTAAASARLPPLSPPPRLAAGRRGARRGRAVAPPLPWATPRAKKLNEKEEEGGEGGRSPPPATARPAPAGKAATVTSPGPTRRASATTL